MRRIEEIMDWGWVPVVLIALKLIVLGTAMFFSIKSHRDKQREEEEEERQRQARAARVGASGGSASPLGPVQHHVEASQGGLGQ